MPRQKTTTTKKTQAKKAAPKRKTAAKKKVASTRSSIDVPKISRPRVVTKESFEEWMDAAIQHFEARRDQIKDDYDNQKKTPNSHSLYMNAVLREFEAIKGRVGKKLVAKRRSTGSHSNGALVAPCRLSKKLTSFLGVPASTRLGRAEVNRAVTAYIAFDPEKKVDTSTPAKEAAYKNKLKWVKKLNKDGKVRNLQDAEDRSVIHPDSELADLLNYKQYKRDVKAGKIKFNKKDKKTGEVKKTKQTDAVLNYAVLQHLLAPHFLKDGDVGKETVEDVAESEEDVEEVSDVDEDDDVELDDVSDADLSDSDL